MPSAPAAPPPPPDTSQRPPLEVGRPQRASPALTPARALRRPGRTDPRLVVGAMLTLIGVLGAAISWSGSTGGQAVLVTTRELPAGSKLGLGDVAPSRVRLGEATLRSAVPASEQGALIGRELAEPVHEQQLLHRSHLAGRPLLSGEQRAMTIPAGPDRAAGGLIRSGDQVMVVVTPRAPSDSGAEVVLSRATVYAVGYDERAGGLGPGSGAAQRRGPIVSLTLLVTDGQALLLARARARGELDVALLPPDGPAATAASPR